MRADEMPATAAPDDRTVARRARPLRGAAITLYATFLLLTVAIPGSVVGALRDAPRSVLTNALLAGAERVEAALETLGVPHPYRIAKERFRNAACAGQESENPC